MQAIGRYLKTTLALAVIVIGGAVAYACTGWYDLSVGSGHTAPVQWRLETVRANAVERPRSVRQPGPGAAGAERAPNEDAGGAEERDTDG
jgi:hypothetical protein